MQNPGYEQPLPRWATFLGAAFVALLLVALITIPIVINSITERHRNEVRNYVESGEKIIVDTQLALSRSVSGIQGFQATDRQAFAEIFRDQNSRIDQLLKNLKPVSEHFAPELTERSSELERVIGRWRHAVEENGLLTKVLPAEEFRQRMFAQDHFLQSANQVAADYQLDLSRIRVLYRERIEALGRLNVILTIVLALMSLGAIVVVWRITRRLRSNAQTLSDRVREEEVLRELAERAVRSRDEMLRVVSHDLRNPLGNISLAGGLLANRNISDEKREHLGEMIHRLTDRMNRIIQDLIDVARVESGHPLPLDLEVLPARTLLEEVCELNRLNADKKKIRLEFEHSGPDVLILADRHRVLQALSNLVDNAVKFSPERGTVRLSVEQAKSDVLFSVTDDGSGIPESHIKQVFAPFWRDARRPEAGIGVGLAIVKNIAELHGGGAGVRNQPGAGSTFYFWVPSADQSHQKSA